MLQLRLHPAVIKLKTNIDNGEPNRVYDVDLSYITSSENSYCLGLEWRYIQIGRYRNKPRCSLF